MSLSKEIKQLEKSVASNKFVVESKQAILQEKSQGIQTIQKDIQEQAKIAQERIDGLNAGIKSELEVLNTASIQMLKDQTILDYLKAQLDDQIEPAEVVTAES